MTKSPVLAAAITCALSYSAHTMAQTSSAEAGASEEGLEVVIVTANRREQAVQDYAGTIQTFSGEDLARLGVATDFRNLQSLVPGLQITRQEGKFEIFLRGIGSADSDFSSDPSVATYYSGVYLPRPRSIGPMFFDVERVEVNKGPQGTVRGRNATGGSINIIARRPELQEFGGDLKVSAGNYDSRVYEAVVNLPVGETFAVRGAFFSEAHDPYYKNAYDAEFDAPGAIDNTAYRVSALWEPNENFSAYVMADRVTEGGTGDPGVFANRALAAGYDVDDINDPFRQYFRTEGKIDNEIEGIAGVFTYNFGGFSLEYNVSHREYEFYNRNASREWQLGFVYPGTEIEAFHNPERLQWNDTFYQAESSSSTINELRAFGESGPLIWSAGVFHYDESYDYLSWDVGNGYFGDCDWFIPGTVCGWQDGLGGENRGDDSEVTSQAVYADLTFSLSESMRVLAGARYTEDEKTARESNVKYQFVVPEALFSAFGLTPNTTTNPYNTGLILGSSGFQLRDPGSRRLRNPNICTSFDASALNCNGGTDNSVAYFLDGIQSFGSRDNWDDFLRQYGDQVDVIIRSDFPDGRSVNVYEDSYIDWRAGFEYDIDADKMLYATISTGTRSGGINRPLALNDGTVLARTWDPEELTAYEIGSKNDFNWAGNPVRLNAAVFYYDYENKVVQNLIAIPSPTPTNPAATTLQVFSDNAANAEVLGLELEGQIGLPYGLSASYNLTYLDATFKESPILDTRSGGERIVVDIDGNQLPNTSKYNLNLALAQTIPVSWGPVSTLDWSVNMMYRSKYYLTAFNNQGYGRDANGNVIRIPLADMEVNNGSNPAQIGPPANGLALRDDVDSFAIFNASLGFNFGSEEQFRVMVFGANLTDEVYSGKGFINESVNIRYLNTPRTYGVQFSAGF